MVKLLYLQPITLLLSAVVGLEAYPTVFKGLRGLIHRFLAQVQLAAQVAQAQGNPQDRKGDQVVVALGLVVTGLPPEYQVKVIPVAREVVVLSTLVAVEVEAQLAVQEMHLCKAPEVMERFQL
jgi:hypothetical protein